MENTRTSKYTPLPDPKIILWVCFGIIALMFLMDSAFALSEPINQSLDEFTNMTRADNFLELAIEMNTWLGGLFGITFLIGIFAVSFGMTMFFTRTIASSLLFSMFITTLSSVFLMVVGLVPEYAVVFCVPLFIMSLVYVVLTK